jgi:predicted LPLAT superfamily acyltransferase
MRKTLADPANQRRSPDYGNRIGHAIFYGLIRWLGVTPAYWLLALIVPYYVLCRPSARRSAEAYLGRRFPGQGALRRFWTTTRYFYRFGQVLIDQSALGILGRDRFKVEFPRERELYELAQQRRGLVLLTTHAGSWHAAMGSMGHLGVPVHFQLRLAQDAPGRHFFELSGERDQFRIISPEGFLGGVVELTHALQEGECISMMGDRAWGAKTRRMRFLGEEASFPVIPYQLALRTGAELVALLAVRTGKMACRIEMTRLTDQGASIPASREEALDALLGRYVRCVERYLDKYPFMWFNYFDLWKNKDEA